MQKYLLYLGILLCTILPFNAFSAEWKELGNVYVHEMIVKVYVTDELQQDDNKQEGYKSLWVKFELPKNTDSNIENKEYRIRKEKYHYHCDQKLFAVSHLILLDREEKTVYDSGAYNPYAEEYSKSWKLVSPKSGQDLIYHYICSEKIKTASANNKTVNQAKNGLLPKPIKLDEIDETYALDIKKIRWGKHEDYERLVFDIYKGDNPVEKPKNYKVTKLGDKNKLRFELNGLTIVSAKFPDIKKSTIVKKIYKEPRIKENNQENYIIFIDFADSSEFKAFELENPGRIVIDFKNINQ